MSKMYQQYDRQRVDDVDPQERQNYPISTISGISDSTLQQQQAPIKSSVQVKEVDKSEEKQPDVTSEPLQNGEAESLDEAEGDGKISESEKGEGDGKASDETKDDKTSEGTETSAAKKIVEKVINDVTSKSEETSKEKKTEIPKEITSTGVRRNPSRAQSFRAMETHGNRHVFSPGPRAPPFRIPEFRWSGLHQKLLSDLLFSVETDLQVWKR